MSKINRFNGDMPIFAENASENYMYNFGQPNKSDFDGELDSLLNDNFKTGWEVVSPSVYPPKQWFNSSMRGMSQAVAYLYQSGVAEWNAEQEYYANGKCQHNGVTYTSVGDSNVGNEPSVKSSFWRTESAYNPDRIYAQNETCTTYNRETGELETWLSYSPGDNQGNDPTDPVNRHEQWPDHPTPCWWIKYHGAEPGVPVHWFSNDIPENALQIIDTDISADFYHRIAKNNPSLVVDGKINLAEILGRYFRVADGVDYIVNTTHEDAMRNITAEVFGSTDSSLQGLFHAAAGAFSVEGEMPNIDSANLDGNGFRSQKLLFDASLVVPTAPQNMPVSAVVNYIMFM